MECIHHTFAIRDGVEDTRLEAKAKVTKKFRDHGQNFSRPRTKDTDASVLRKKKGLQKILTGDLKKKVFKSFFSGEKGLKIFFRRSPREENKKRTSQIFREASCVFNKILRVQDIVLSSSRGQGNFRGHEASRPRTSKCVLEDSTSVCYTSDKSQLLTYFCQSTLSSSLMWLIAKLFHSVHKKLRTCGADFKYYEVADLRLRTSRITKLRTCGCGLQELRSCVLAVADFKN